ncbi:MAG: AMP-binding protein [Euzebyaceae bacterium]|nr:AMP-binding protein [Euzebyaceae bacterium]
MAAGNPDGVALQEKHYGIWEPISWREYHQRVRDFALGLAELGVAAGEVVGVLGDNRPEWLAAELAAQSLGAATVGIYPTSVGEEIVHILTHAEVRVVVAEDQEQVDKLISLWDRLDTVDSVIYYDPHGLEHYEAPYLRHFPDVEALGRGVAGSRGPWLDEQIEAGRADDVAVICTTSGTTARPKLAMLSHRNLLSMGRALRAIDPLEPEDRYVSFLPFAWIGEQMIALACGLQVGFPLSFPEEAGTVRSDLREIGPSVIFSPPRIWESMISDVQVRLGEAGWLKRSVFAWGYRVGDRVAEQRVRGKRPGVLNRVLYRAADWVALRPMRDQLGLTRLKRCYTGGAPLGPDVFRFFHAVGVNLKQIYGQTEICGIAVAHRDGDVKFNTVGTPIPGCELRIADDGEILLRSPAVFLGYLDEEGTAQAVDRDGWLHTGDAGYLDEDGHLVVIDRARDVLQTEDGTRFSPAFVENKLKFSPYVEEAVVFGGQDRPFITAIITIDGATVGTWAEREHLSYTTYTNLAGRDEVYRLIAEEVTRANEDLPEAVRVRRFLLLHKQLDPDDDEITRTRKVRRRVISQRYADLIAALETGADTVTVTSLVTYQDGSSAQREIALKILAMDDFVPPQRSLRRLAWSTRS